MPKGMCLRSNWNASHIADPRGELTLDAYCRENQIQIGKPIPLDQFVGYGRWFQQKAVPDLDTRSIRTVEPGNGGFKIKLEDGETFSTKRVVVAAGIQPFASRPPQFDRIPRTLVSHSNEHEDLSTFAGKSVAVIGGGQSASESAALLKESGAEVEVICRRKDLHWVGLHPRLHRLGLLSKMLYSPRDVGPAGISRLVAAPHMFRLLPRSVQDRMAYRAIRPAVAGWLKNRISEVPITLGRRVVSAEICGNRVHLKLDDGTERFVDHVLLATGYQVDVKRYGFLAPTLLEQIRTVNGFPVLGRGLESSVAGLHFLGKPGAWSFGPIVGFVSGTTFASPELARAISRSNGNGR